jgi:hypothetical protein
MNQNSSFVFRRRNVRPSHGSGHLRGAWRRALCAWSRVLCVVRSRAVQCGVSGVLVVRGPGPASCLCSVAQSTRGPPAGARQRRTRANSRPGANLGSNSELPPVASPRVRQLPLTFRWWGLEGEACSAKERCLRSARAVSGLWRGMSQTSRALLDGLLIPLHRSACTVCGC